ncbi:MAG: rRNA maturation RNase YbeY [Kiritimatiellae bacterium]|jgi:ssRNA-specific RNase YbeY (16S rRNA maturation enzyme)|nr:rRNA maturation RNase YbeY [Kiritimatiellia bacterium]
MQINIANYEYPDALDETSLIDLVRQLAEMAQKDMVPDLPWQELTIHILSDVSIAPIHQTINGVEGTTDVITQRYDPFPGEPQGLTGEIFINLQCVSREGSKVQLAESTPSWSVDKELALYIAHGCDHLNDNEDLSENDYQSMRARELSWLEQLRLTPVVIKSII